MGSAPTCKKRVPETVRDRPCARSIAAAGVLLHGHGIQNARTAKYLLTDQGRGPVFFELFAHGWSICRSTVVGGLGPVVEAFGTR
jgi:hypothetical protein